MLSDLIGSLNNERALICLIARERGYARQIVRFFAVPLDPVQKALDGLERPVGKISQARTPHEKIRFSGGSTGGIRPIEIDIAVLALERNVGVTCTRQAGRE